MRRTARISLCVACACLPSSWATPRLECGTDEVRSALTSMVREHVQRRALDAYTLARDASDQARFAKAIRVTADTPRLVSWDKGAGRLACTVRIVIEVPGPEIRSKTPGGAELAYRVTGGDDGRFFIEIAYVDLTDLLAFRMKQVSATKPQT